MKVFLQLNKNACKHLQHWQWINFFGWRYCWTGYFNYISYMNRKSRVFSILVLEFLIVITNSSRWINFRACQFKFSVSPSPSPSLLLETNKDLLLTNRVHQCKNVLSMEIEKKIISVEIKRRQRLIPYSEIWRFQISN